MVLAAAEAHSPMLSVGIYISLCRTHVNFLWLPFLTINQYSFLLIASRDPMFAFVFDESLFAFEYDTPPFEFALLFDR